MTVTALRNTNNGSFLPAEHLEFVRNTQRNAAFKAAFERLAAGKTVLDVGTGSGILAIYAARAGAKQVIAVEKDKAMAKIAQANFERNGLNNRIKLIVADAFDLRRSDLQHVDMLVGEMLSTWCVIESQVQVFKHLINITGASVTMPRRVINYAEGVHAVFGDAERLVVIPTTYFEFEATRPKAEKMTIRRKASEIILSSDAEFDPVISISLRVLRTGVINAMRLTSITEVCEGITFNPRDDTMPRMIVPLPREIAVTAGQMVNLTIRYTYAAGWDKFIIDV